MRNLVIFLLSLLFPFLGHTSDKQIQQRQIQGFRVGLRVPIATGEQRILTPDVGIGVEVRLDSALRDLPLGFALISSYDEFFLALPDEEIILPDGSVFVLSKTQSLSYTNFTGEATFRFKVGRLTTHASTGPGVSIGFFNRPPQGTDGEIIVKAFMPAISGGAGLALTLGKRAVIDLAFRYQHLFFNNKTIQQNNTDVRVFNDTAAVGLTAGYLF